jgi:hypothetical protein
MVQGGSYEIASDGSESAPAHQSHTPLRYPESPRRENLQLFSPALVSKIRDPNRTIHLRHRAPETNLVASREDLRIDIMPVSKYDDSFSA